MATRKTKLVSVAIIMLFEILMVRGKPSYINSCNYDCKGKLREPVCAEDNTTMVTYDNKCELEVERCKTPTITFVHDGECKEKCKGVKCPPGQSCIYDQDGFSYCIESDCDEVLTKTCSTDGDSGGNGESNKVCGLDNLTYDSMCHLKQTSCKTHQVLLKRYDGPCGTEKTCADITCGSGESCVTTNDGTPRCINCCRSKKKKSTIIQLSMCGSDKKKYSSWCDMRAESCRTGKLIQFYGWVCP